MHFTRFVTCLIAFASCCIAETTVQRLAEHDAAQRAISNDNQLDRSNPDTDDTSKYQPRQLRDSRHYVRFGRTPNDAGLKMDDVTDYAGASYQSADGFPRPVRAEKQQAPKHYVRFGRSQAALPTAEETSDTEEEVKRSGGASKHYVRFGRSQGVPDASGDESVEKRSKHYVRFG